MKGIALAGLLLLFAASGHAAGKPLNIRIKINLNEQTFRNVKTFVYTIQHPAEGFHRNMADLNTQLHDRQNWKRMVERQVVNIIRKQAR